MSDTLYVLIFTDVIKRFSIMVRINVFGRNYYNYSSERVSLVLK